MFLLASLALANLTRNEPKLVSNGLAGYISMEVPAPPEGYGYGVSLYAAAWPLLERPLRDFQIGLASIWIVPDNRQINYSLLPTGTLARDNWPERGPSYRDVFQTIEGGLGFWANTRYWTLSAKFRMNGTPDGYNHEISTPGWGFGGGQGRGDADALRSDQMGIAQLSPRILVPPDGLSLKKGTCGELLGYAWMALPLIQAKSTTAGLPVPTGNQCWTLFLNSTNFKGPVAFYTPATWSRISRRYQPASGRGLDALPGLVTGGAIEVNTVPRMVAQDEKGATYARIPKLQFPADKEGRTVLIHNLSHYSKEALFNQVESWLQGGAEASGRFEEKGVVVPKCRANPLVVRQGEKNLTIQGCENWVQTQVFDGTTFGLLWKPSAMKPWKGSTRKATFPDYCRQDANGLVAIPSAEVPAETGLAEAQFPAAEDETAYTSPGPGDNVWHHPGPAAGPFTAKLADGSVVTYYWYRFVDQPALQDADLSVADKGRLQAAVEKIHAHWTAGKQYIPPPKIGVLASMDPALLVEPPRGLEVGYVPIAVHQSAPTRADRNRN